MELLLLSFTRTASCRLKLACNRDLRGGKTATLVIYNLLWQSAPFMVRNALPLYALAGIWLCCWS